MYVDPITGKMYLGERRNPGMEMWTDPDTGITYVRTADGMIKLHDCAWQLSHFRFSLMKFTTSIKVFF